MNFVGNYLLGQCGTSAKRRDFMLVFYISKVPCYNLMKGRTLGHNMNLADSLNFA